MPKRLHREACVPETVLQADGEVKTIMLDERYLPYPGKEARLENLCGSFTEQVCAADLQGVLVNTHTQFGRQKEVFNVHGNASIHRGKANFMGVRSMEALEALAKGLNLLSARNTVHMAVICAKIGKRVQVTSSGLLETRLSTAFTKNLRVEGRMYDHTNTVRLSVHTFSTDGGVFSLDKRFWPTKNDWTITGRGTVMVRLSWKQIEWSKECEEACLSFCDSILQTCLRQAK
jgi:hypothetical protein